MNERLAKNMLEWVHSGLSLDASIGIPASSSKKREALARYIVRRRGERTEASCAEITACSGLLHALVAGLPGIQGR